MVCQKCKTEFCWLCLGNYKGYQHDPGMAKYCGQGTGFKVLFLVLSIVILISKLVGPMVSSYGI